MTKTEAAEAVMALWRNSRGQGLSFLARDKPSVGNVMDYLGDEGAYFDYYAGRVMKVDFTDYANRELDDVSGRLYDRDNGAGAFLRAVTS